ncbi:GNAT family N-acetyltransferase [Bacillus inaquosorum]|uniref:N-acetyltransferase n=1 Tax=Bacillus inaquosorum TaxID=483913 RepID=A0A9Q4ET49_9BACI|nr:N-acetyltransferase [Bacillus inaquosorum]PPA37676.1 N-acetyltransferase [Bacillus subtilis]AMA52435.1 GCN5 family acetyltransferase [Bacillus inaquosorum]MBT2191345.1 N-acetyltransferase [Bacillus inaquosorum]MBT3120257.1 N-acetyltransferase [Bacillus inaquosorum]MBT3121237.1 N-acetyltransferase [Bacillus inaquosorum]
MEFFIRQELTHEYNTTEDIVKRAFLNEKYSDKKEHFLVNKIRKSDAFIPELSLVALNGKEIVGHILLSKIKIVDGDNAVDSLALAPVSVAPEYQRKGIGSQLIHVALKKAKELGYRSVIVLGHKDYYPKFGFKPASLWNIKAPFEVPDEVFMALELSKDSLENVKGVVHYSKAFSV